jgi:beta-N-acetylhexosaminidase
LASALKPAVTRTTSTATMTGAPRPQIVQKPIPFDASRREERAAYARRHYGLDSWRLERPKVIVEHYTANESLSGTWNTFATDVADQELHEKPGTCAPFVVDPPTPARLLSSLPTRNRKSYW